MREKMKPPFHKYKVGQNRDDRSNNQSSADSLSSEDLDRLGQLRIASRKESPSIAMSTENVQLL